jgi:hypothetical protein
VSRASRLGVTAVFKAPDVPAGYAKHGPDCPRKKRDPERPLLRNVTVMGWGERTSPIGDPESMESPLFTQRLVDRRGLEPLTSAVQGRRSPS